MIDASVERNTRRAAGLKRECGAADLLHRKLYSAADPCSCSRWAGDNKFDSVRWPDLLVSAQTEGVPRNVTFDMGKKVCVCCNAKSRGPALPFNFKCSAGIDFRKRGNCSIFCFDMPVATNAWPSTSSRQQDAHSQDLKNKFLHRGVNSGDMMQRQGALDSRKIVNVSAT